MPNRVCLQPLCPEPATFRGRCQQHAKERDSQTHGQRSVYNNKRWRYARKRRLFLDPLCPCGQIATDVDHITPLERGGEPYALGNLQSLCKSCHARKTNQEVRSRL